MVSLSSLPPHAHTHAAPPHDIPTIIIVVRGCHSCSQSAVNLVCLAVTSEAAGRVSTHSSLLLPGWEDVFVAKGKKGCFEGDSCVLSKKRRKDVRKAGWEKTVKSMEQ